ncbi:hypothetical protein GGR54DRAFT_637487 [Hypoxylon sp. NC1633]|nr:hypothetical protein GGR54DRAFT_637487 [Hypoxylon sp. NC1633]
MGPNPNINGTSNYQATVESVDENPPQQSNTAGTTAGAPSGGLFSPPHPTGTSANPQNASASATNAGAAAQPTVAEAAAAPATDTGAAAPATNAGAAAQPTAAEAAAGPAAAGPTTAGDPSSRGPPIGRRARAAMEARPYPGVGYIFNCPGPMWYESIPRHNAAHQYVGPPPMLWVNPPLVAPSVPAPIPGNTGSWCYPRQSPFWAGSLASQTNPPPGLFNQGHQLYSHGQQVHSQGYGQTEYYLLDPSGNAHRVQYILNGSTGPILCYQST